MQPISVGRLALLVALAGTSCKPASITEARDQLGRGEPRTISLTVPITADTFTIARFLEETDTATTSDGLIGIPIDSQAVSVAVGEELEFSGLNFDAFSFGYDQMLATNPESVQVDLVTPSAPFGSSALRAPPANGVGFQTDNGSAVQQAVIGTGWMVREVVNGTACTGTVNVTATDSLGLNVVNFPPLVVPPNGTAVDSVNASNSTMNGFVVIGATAIPGGLCIPASGTTVSTKIVFRPMTLGSVTLVNLNEPFTDTYNALASESRVQAVDTIVVNSGSFTLTAQNKLPISLNFDVQLDGIVSNGLPETASFVIPAAPGDGSTTTGMVTFDLTGDTIVPSAVVATINGSVTAASATITSALVANAVQVSAGGDLTVETLIGTLDPAQTPELSVTVEDFVEVSSADFDFGDFEDAIRDATINNAEATLVVTNTSGVPIVLQSFFLGVSRIDPATGRPTVDANGDFVLETDANGDTIRVLVADPNQTTLTIGRAATTTVSLELAPVGDRIVKLALDDIDVALVATGSAVAGDGSAGQRIDRADVVDFAVDLVIGLDMTLPPTGISFQVNDVERGGELETDLADDVAERVVNAGLTSTVVNGTPFALMVEVAYVDGDRGVDFDVFTAADRIEVTPVTVAAPNVDAQGIVVAPTSSDVSVGLSGAQIEQLLGDFVSASIRITLMPGPGGSGRGAVRPDDEVMLSAGATIEIQGGN